MKVNRGTSPNVSMDKKSNPVPLALLTCGVMDTANELAFERRRIG